MIFTILTLMTLMDLAKIKAHTHPLTHLIIHQTNLTRYQHLDYPSESINVILGQKPTGPNQKPLGDHLSIPLYLSFFVVEVFCLEVRTILFGSTAAEPEPKNLGRQLGRTTKKAAHYSSLTELHLTGQCLWWLNSIFLCFSLPYICLRRKK